MKNLRLSKTALRELSHLYRGILVATLVVATVATTDAKATDTTFYVDDDGKIIEINGDSIPTGGSSLAIPDISDKQDTLTAGSGISIDPSTDTISVSGLTTSNFGENVIQTTVRATTDASDGSIATEKAVADALAEKQDKLTVGSGISITSNEIAASDLTTSNFDSNVIVSDNITTGATDKLATTDAVVDSIQAQAENATFTTTNAKNIEATSNTIHKAVMDLDSAIGAQTTGTYGNIFDANTVNANLDSLDAAIGKRSDWTKNDAGEALTAGTALTANSSLSNAVSQLNVNVGTTVTGTNGNVVATNSVNQNLDKLDTNIGNLEITSSKVAGADVSTKLQISLMILAGIILQGNLLEKSQKQALPIILISQVHQ